MSATRASSSRRINNPPLEFLHFHAIFHGSTHYMWGRRFRLPTRYVLSQKASPLASRSHGGNLPVCHLAFGLAPSRGPGCRTRTRAPLYPPAEPSSSLRFG